jgi:ribulose-phosphate 3-epimerase
MGKDPREYRAAIERVCEFAERIHIDFADGKFAPTKLVPIVDTWWPVGLMVDFHIMYQKPLEYIEDIIYQQPHLVIIHAEAEGVEEFLSELEGLGIKLGVALLKQTPVDTIKPILEKLDHVLIFSGDLGYYGGIVDYGLLDKVEELRQLKPEIEIGWDGGVKDGTALRLADGGVDVLNVGGYIQNSPNPEAAYDTLNVSIS